jgi:hypothetical protein
MNPHHPADILHECTLRQHYQSSPGFLTQSTQQLSEDSFYSKLYAHIYGVVDS